MAREAFRRPAHREVLALLAAMNAGLLRDCACHFGGGTRIVLELGEYRESKDIDFLCASQEGYRTLREAIGPSSLGRIVKGRGVRLAREVRADQYGIRTFFATATGTLKFEIVREARIALAGGTATRLPVACLDHTHCFAEKFLANADRGLDASTLSRDIVDLAFMIEGWEMAHARAGMAVAESAYGTSVRRSLGAVREKLRGERAYRNRCMEGLGIEDAKTLSAGLKALAAFL
jgi:hypothetical protein